VIDNGETAITVRGFCDGSDRASVTIGPRNEGDLAVLLREAHAECQAARSVPHADLGPTGPRYLCSGEFVEGPLGLKLAPGDIKVLALARAAVLVRLLRNTDAFRERIFAERGDEELEDYLPPPDGATPEVEVMFGLFGPEMDFDLVEKTLGFEATYTHVPSRPFSSEGEPRRRQWVRSSGPIRTLDFDEPLRRQLRQIAPLVEKIRTLAGEMNLEPSVDLVVLEYSDRVPTLALTPDDLQVLASLDASLWLDIL
jgi:uncharacterized protein DUF4279